MRYTTPTYPVYRSAGSVNKNDCPYPGPYPVFQLAGFEAGVPVPNPSPPPPKHGHWRITPNGKLRPRTRGRATANMPNMGQVPRDIPHVHGLRKAHHAHAANASLRTRVREAVAAGLIAAEDAPSWAQPQ